MKKKLICALMTAAMAGSLVSGLTVSADSDSQVTISLYTTLPNKDAQFEQLCEEFMEENPDIKVNYIAYDSSEKQKWMTLYASGDAPTISIMDPVDIQQNIENMAAYDLTEDSWITDQVDESYLDVFKGEDGELYAVPNCVTAMGIVYNKTVIEKATGETFDPSTIKSNADLEALCEKIQAGGVAPIMFTGVDWSLGSHYLSQVFELKVYLDGDEEYPTICGTGTEDYFGGAWSFTRTENGVAKEQTYCTPFMGYPYYSREDDTVYNPYHMNDTPTERGFYRWHILDPILFDEDIRVTIQQIGVCHKGLFERQDDVSSVAYWYQSEPHQPFPKLLSKEERWPR